MSFRSNAGAVVVCVLALVACGPSGDDDGGGSGADGSSGPALVSIAVQPADQVLTIDGDTPATATYVATGTFDDGHQEDVSARARFALSDAGLGSFAADRFTSTLARGGRGRVIASLDGVDGDTGITLRIKQRYSDPDSGDLPADPSGPFDGPADAGRAPALVYPGDGVLVPPNLRLLEVHFRRGTGNTLFELSFQNDLTDVLVYARCTRPMAGGCIFTPDPVLWRWLADTNRGGQELTVRARGTDDDGSGVGSSDDIHVAFSHDDVKGGIYYWKAAGGDGGSAIMRFDFGNTAQTAAERFAGPEKAGGKCVGCHALSRDGSKMVAPAGGWDVEGMLLLDTATGSSMGTPARSAFASWNPDGSRYVGVFAYQGTTSYDLLLFDGGSGSPLGVIDIGATAERSATHPDWSPDGSRIVYTRTGKAYDGGVNNQRFYRGGIQMVEDAGGGTWGSPVDLVASQAGVNNYYPSFAPGGQLIAFNRSTCPSGDAHVDCNGDSDPTASIYVMKPEAGASPIELAHANAPGPTDPGSALTNSWPRWAPFVFQRTDDPDTHLVWITFSSTRRYGLRTPPGSTGEASSGSFLWMAAVDPDRAAAGDDPSYPAFCLPFQDLDTSNHIAQWTEEVVDVE